MKSNHFFESFGKLWQSPADALEKPMSSFQLVLIGFIIGCAAGAVIAIFRITTSLAYETALHWTAKANILVMALWIGGALCAGLAVGYLIKNPAIRFGGADWIRKSIEDGQPRVWKIILLPKFIGSWLVMAFGVSVGREGPCIQMGAATALGLHKIGLTQKVERRLFILAGGAAGLAAAFSAPFAGVCYVYEVMNQKLNRGLFVFMMAGGLGVYLSCTQFFGLGVMLPIEQAITPSLGRCWILLPLGFFTGIVGILYSYFLRISTHCWQKQGLIPLRFRPVCTFLAAGLMVLIFPAVTGEGLGIFPDMEAGKLLPSFLIMFLAVKLLFTAFCYGSGIPAGIMVPILCLGGVTGGIYADCLHALGILGQEEMLSCVVIGMAAAFAASEKAPITAIVLVAEMTGAYAAIPGMLLTSAIASFLARIAMVERML